MAFANTFTIDFFYELARGPLVWICILISIMGSVWRTRALLSHTRLKTMDDKMDLSSIQKKAREKKPAKINIAEYLAVIRNTILGTNPAVILVTSFFHCCLIVVPFFILAHNVLIKEAIGISLPSFPEGFSDVLTAVILTFVLFFLGRRSLSFRVRSITTLSDYTVLFIVGAPFLTGFFAFHQIFDYKTVITLHMLAGELMLIAIPFTKIFHMVFFFVGRFMLVHQHTIGKGSRTW